MSVCKYRGTVYRGCDGLMYVPCVKLGKDIEVGECGCATSSPKDYCGFYETNNTDYENE